MTQSQKISLVFLRIVFGWYFFYAGITKIMSGNFSAEGYLKGAKLMTGFYNALLSPGILPSVNFVNEWGLTLLGVSLILGIFVRLSAPLGILLMILYWIPLGIIHPDAHSMVVDDHIFLVAGLLVLVVFKAGRFWGVDGWRAKRRGV